MSDDWGEGNSGSAKKGGLPGWLMFCGGGCLLLILAAGVVGFLGFRWARDGMDPEKGVERISQHLELDGIPEGYAYQWGNRIPIVGFEMYLFQQSLQAAQAAGQPAALQAIVMVLPEGADEGVGGRGEPGVLLVQGTELDTFRYVAEAGESFDPSSEGDESVSQDMRFEEGGAVLILDLTAHLRERKGAVVLNRKGSGEPITDEEARAFLAPFHIGPDRSWTPGAGAPSPDGGDGAGDAPSDDAAEDDGTEDDGTEEPGDAGSEAGSDPGAGDDSDGR